MITDVIGDIRFSMLTEVQYQAEVGNHWVLCDGRNISGSDLATLLGITNLPDARGGFLRSINNTRSDGKQDPSGERTPGNYQADDNPYHTHSYSYWSTLATDEDSSDFQMVKFETSYNSSNAGGVEFRPKNICMNCFIMINRSSKKGFTHLGETTQSLLTETQFQTEIGNSNIVLMDGRLITGSDLAILTGLSNLPDARGIFMRMKDHGAGIDSGGERSIGAYQVDQIQSHSHTYGTYNNSARWDNVNDNNRFVRNTSNNFGYSGSEGRPKNIAVNTLIQINKV